MIHVIGIISSTLFMCCYIPQIVAILRTKNVSGISVAMWVIVTAGFTTGLVYVIFREEPVLIVSHAVGLILSLLTLGLVVYHGKKQ